MRTWTIALATLTQLALSAGCAFAQGRVFTVGPITGVALASWRGADVQAPAAFRTGFIGGAFVSVGVSKRLTVEAQALYVQKGVRLTPSGGPPVTWIQNYVEIPLLLRGTFPIRGAMRFAPTIFAGPAVGFRVACKFTSSGPIATAPCDSLLAGQGASMRHTDALVVLGAGFNVGPFALLARYDLGLTKLFVQQTTQDVRTKTWLMTAGVRLPFRKD